MARAVAVINTSKAARLQAPLQLLTQGLSALWRVIGHDAAPPYRPERHYMRGPGPAWHAKHGQKLPG